jgi:hypothetical protein
MSKITQRQIAKIAAATKANCSANGLGHVISVFGDGSHMLAISQNDVIARGAPGGGWEYRIACLKYPMTRDEVAEELSRAMAAQADEQDYYANQI